jgi:hypothetical protein
MTHLKSSKKVEFTEKLFEALSQTGNVQGYLIFCGVKLFHKRARLRENAPVFIRADLISVSSLCLEKCGIGNMIEICEQVCVRAAESSAF